MKELPTSLIETLLLTHTQEEVAKLAGVDRAIISKSLMYPTKTQLGHHRRAAKLFLTDLEAQMANSEDLASKTFCAAYMNLVRSMM